LTAVPGGYVLSVEGLFVAFIEAVRKYESEVRKDPVVKANFERMFPAYGSLNVAV
jgi:hypothetical protein